MSALQELQRDSIAIFSPTLTSGGSEHVLAMLVEQLCRRHYSVERVVGHSECVGDTEYDGNGAIMRGLGAARMLGSVRPLVRYLKQHKPRCLISSLTYTNILAVASVLLARTHTPVIIREATTVSAYARVSHSTRNQLLPALVRVFYRHADRIIAVSEGVRDDLVNNLGVPAEKVRVIYNPVDVARLRRLAAQEVPHPWFNDGECPVVVSVARLDESKDFDSLLRAIEIVNKQRCVRFVVLGEGHERTRIESLAVRHRVVDRIWLPGHQQNPWRFLARANLFLHPSRVEGLPNAVLEALALGCPIVSSDCDSGPREILLGGRYGRLVPVGDSSAMANAVLESLEVDQASNVDPSRMDRFETGRVIDAYLAEVADVSRSDAGPLQRNGALS